MTSTRLVLALVVVLVLALFAGCATPIANAYKESRIPSPPHVLAARGIALAEMLVLNPTLYYPLEMMGIADFDLVWRDEEMRPLRYDDAMLLTDPLSDGGNEATPVFEEPMPDPSDPVISEVEDPPSAEQENGS